MRKLLLSGCLIFLFCSSTRAFGEQSPSDNARNYQSCLAGYASCDQSKLTDTQRDDVHRAALRRNYNSCLNGYASCDQSKLTDTQRDDVHRAALQRNYNSCLYGYASCDQSRLTESEKEAIAKRGSSKTHLRWLLVRGGVPAPVVQAQLTDIEDRFVGRADMYYPSARLVVEYDGGANLTQILYE